MRFLVSLLAVGMLALTGLTGCNSTEKAGGNTNAASTTTTTSAPNQTPAQPQRAATPSMAPSDGVRRMSVAELDSMLKKGGAVVVDVRNDAAFKQGRIKGSVLIPFTEIGNRSNELPRDKMIVTYCAWPAEHTSAGAVLTLKQKGIENAAALLGGYQAWIGAGLPIESGQ